MKKLFVSLFAVAILASVVSCKKTETSEEIILTPVYKEGVYHPIMKVASVSENGILSQEWSWNRDNLDHITWIDDGVKTYTYTGDYITKVVSNQSMGEELRYTYADGQMTKCEVYYQDAMALSVDLQHNASGKISGGEIMVDDNFLMNLAGQLLGQGSFFERLVGTPAAQALVKMAQVARVSNGAKLGISDKTFSTTFIWNGENVDKQVLNGSFILNISSEDLELVQNFIDIPEQYLTIIQMAMMLGSGSIPLQIGLTDTISATYDNMYNPMFCNWGDIMSPQTLSQSNILTMNNNMLLTVSIALMGQNQELFRYPNNTSEEYRYEYNDKKYPTKVTGTNEIVYTYKN